MAEFSVEVEIPAPPERVWEVLTDFAAYEDWHPYLAVTGSADLFSWVTLTVRRTAPGQAAVKGRAVVWNLDPGKRLELLSGKILILMSNRFAYLSPTEKGTLVRHGIKTSGILAKRTFAPDETSKQLQPFYEAVSHALFKRVASPRSAPRGAGNRRSRRASTAKGRKGS